MEHLIPRLMELMTQEKALYQDLLEQAMQKKEAIIKDQVAVLTSITQMEGQAVLSAKKLDAEKVALLSRMQEEMGGETLPTLGEIIQQEKDPVFRQTLSEMQDSFVSLILELSTQNMINQQLLETQLQYTDFCLELMTQPDSVGDFYGSSGQVAGSFQEERRSLIDRKI